MPWPATHILIAEKVYDQYFSHLDRKDFLLGTSFPDIRYPAKLNRHQTHLPNQVISGDPISKCVYSRHDVSQLCGQIMERLHR